VAKSCLEFVAAWKSKNVSCMTCLHWNSDDFVCMESDDYKKLDKDMKTEEIAKFMQSNKPIKGPL
jgi:hypothetical protein